MTRAGLALDGSRAAVTWRRRSWSLAQADLSQLFVELAIAVPLRTPVDVVLLPPLVRCRFVSLPPMSDQHVRSVIARDLDRLYLHLPSDPVISVRRCATGDVLVAMASDALLRELTDAAARAGLRVGTVCPMVEAWERLVRKSRGSAIVACAGRDALEAWTLLRGECATVRRFSCSHGTAEFDAFLRQQDQTDTILLADGEWPELPGQPLPPAMGEHRGSGLTSALEAASAALVRSSTLSLRSTAQVAQARKAASRLCRQLVVCAGLLIAVSAVAQWIDVRRELIAVRDTRAQLAQDVTAALEIRSELDGWNARLLALEAHERRQRPVLPSLAQLATHLPADAFLTSFRATPDSLMFAGRAGSARAAFDGLGRMPILTEVRSLAPITREESDSGREREAFLIGAALRRFAGPGEEIP